MKKKTLLAIFATGMVLGVGAAACGATSSAKQTESVDAAQESEDDTYSDSDESADAENSENSTTADSAANAVNAGADTTSIGAVTSVSDLDFSDMFTDRDSDYSYDESEAVKITLSGNSAECSDSGVSIDGTTITITAEGTYIVSGTSDDGQIIVNAGDNDKVQIVLDGVSITNDDGACIYVSNADKVFLTLADGSVNNLSDTGAEYVQEDDSVNIDGVIFSRDDITVNGTGALNINASYANGIVGKDDVKFTGGTINITATGNAIEGKDSVRIKDGTFNLVSGSEKDGIHSSNEEESGKGYIYIEGGDIEIVAKDDGIHAETVLYIAGGNINVTESYEGLEGDTIDITGGNISVVASDDGLNASTSTSQDEFGFGNMGGGMNYDENAYIHIYGGELYVNAAGDGIDSNGDLYVDGGYVVVDGPENDGNGPLDKGGTAYISGGTVIAVGSSGMAETFSSDSEQYSVLYGFETTLSAGDVITITDSTGTELLSYTLNKTAASVVFSSPELAEGEYTITAGDTTDTITVSDKATTAGQTGGMMGGPGGGPGNGGERPQMQDGERPEMPDGEMPQMQDGERPEMPDGEMPQMQDGERPEMPDTQNSSESDSTEG
ncbi:carbohydrate-binding domain-containing protein [Butyrivibrio sp. WCD3002]|uniref:carbohydrate-binding domain-containing protein n=1 Tax=Butyrivibrio sp. WCD3002 TaxID=1280676 RepID=UPI0004254DB3|nr:carbohydrate-binding domain-containing protein [Butyrivibrio sp. WCD3002]